MAKKLKKYIKCWVGGDFSRCHVYDCPYLANGTVKDHLIDIDELPEYPDSLYLAHEETCNYRCVFCNSRTDPKGDPTYLNACYESIYEKLKPVLPHVKKIGANGRGEVFTSKRILKILSEWKPLAPVEECSASLETNGSLFDAEHWAQISNLGQYNFRVAITVASFDEYTYQLLSGTKLPISKLISNLHFVKGLREQGIINHLEIATVVQERNFFQMPDFVRRCIEEFGADTVRLRHYIIQHSDSPVRDWFTDMRNPYHPHYAEFRKVMQNPIFKHPKVRDWSGGRDSETPDILTFLAQSNRRKLVKLALYELAKWPFRKIKRAAKKILGR